MEKMLKQVRQKVVAQLWQHYRASSVQIKLIEQALLAKNIQHFFLDHFAIIDLPGPRTGMVLLSEIFSTLGFIKQGSDYLADKQNDFTWMAEADSAQAVVTNVLPQVVVADFRLDELPIEIKKIIVKYAKQAPCSPLATIKKLADRVLQQDHQAANQLCYVLKTYFTGRDWPLPLANEFYTVQEFNKLLAWVLIFGRRPNHFTLSIHLLNYFADLTAFNFFIEEEVKLTLNREGALIKGGPSIGIAQCSTVGTLQTIALADRNVLLSTEFVEFVWRYPKPDCPQPKQWQDYFTGFIAQHADRVIESLYISTGT